VSAVRKHLLADLAFEPAQRIGDAADDLVCEHQADRVAEEVISAQVEFEVVAQEQPMAPDGFAERGAVGIVGREPEQTARDRPVHQPRRDRTRVPGIPRESRAADRRCATPAALQREQSLTVAGFGVAAVGRCECGRVRKFVQQGLPEPGSDIEVGAEPVDFGAELQRSAQEGEAACECVTADFRERVFAMGGAVVRDPGQARVVEAGRGQAGGPLPSGPGASGRPAADTWHRLVRSFVPTLRAGPGDAAGATPGSARDGPAFAADVRSGPCFPFSQ